jgi:ABC-2 type transport system ATP-binding protein
MGMSPKDRARRSDEMLERVGLAHAKDRPIGKFSKGMMQRVGLAQALLHDPELLVLDEPMSGLDPIGRKEVRDLLLEQRQRGKTLVFTSHILSDVEMLCDRVTILQDGLVTAAGTLDALLHRGQRRLEVQLGDVSDEARAALAAHGALVAHGASWVITVDGEGAIEPLLRTALDSGARVEAVLPHRETLENYFVRDAPPRGAVGAVGASSRPTPARDPEPPETHP